MDKKTEIARLKKEIAEKKQQLKELEDVHYRSGCVLFEQNDYWFYVKTRMINAEENSGRYGRCFRIISAKTKFQVISAIDELIGSLSEIRKMVSEDDAIVSRKIV